MPLNVGDLKSLAGDFVTEGLNELGFPGLEDISKLDMVQLADILIIPDVGDSYR